MLCLLVGPSAHAQDAAPVVVTRAEKAPAAAELRLTGTATPRRTSLLSPLTDGLIAELLVDVGDHVDQGQVIARLDDVIARHELATTAAALAEGRARLADAERRRDEAAEVHANRLIAESTYESAVAEAGILAANLQRLAAEHERQREIVGRHVVRAPFPGIVASKLAELGQWVQRGDALFELVDTDVLRVDVPVPQVNYGRLEAGTPAVVLFDAAPDAPIETAVTTRVAVGDPAARTFLARIEIPNESLRFAPGMSARVTLRPAGESGNVLQVARDALTRKPDGSYELWLVEGDTAAATVKPVPVKVQRFTGGVAVLAPGSVQPGDRIVVRGNEGLRPEQSVRILEPSS